MSARRGRGKPRIKAELLECLRKKGFVKPVDAVSLRRAKTWFLTSERGVMEQCAVELIVTDQPVETTDGVVDEDAISDDTEFWLTDLDDAKGARDALLSDGEFWEPPD